jgi:hypothetical protein
VAEACLKQKNWSADFSPFEGLRVSILQVDEGADVSLELLDGCVDASPDLLSGQLGEPALDLIDPRGRKSA